MIQKSHIENFLRINSISITAEDSEIRLALQRARWSDRDVDIAIELLRTNGTEALSAREHTSKILYTNDRVSSEAITSLFKMHIHVPQHTLVRKALDEEDRKNSSMLGIFSAIILSLFIAGGLFWATMYLFSMGPYYSPV